jgi:hypothetical protein
LRDEKARAGGNEASLSLKMTNQVRVNRSWSIFGRSRHCKRRMYRYTANQRGRGPGLYEYGLIESCSLCFQTPAFVERSNLYSNMAMRYVSSRITPSSAPAVCCETSTGPTSRFSQRLVMLHTYTGMDQSACSVHMNRRFTNDMGIQVHAP